ncbi:cupin [Jannaschia donghaensis]|uniref:3-hydroxyanthranilate 3,4-dioxygenase n=1 Tax=Jannaschia donghaensis TaxID=420998 RepID=A0A0M6YI62_9RHOB|nr:cupin [Jannaschia donghaensis]CTQ49469.1 hypothetical protein JDO7802_01483 [Jannaschia donghaensis]
MHVCHPHDFTGTRAWDALDIERIGDATVRLHWTDAPYHWHVNDGPEVFAVLSGQVAMHVRENGEERIHNLGPGDVFHAKDGDEHVAHPVGEARVLVIKRAGSVSCARYSRFPSLKDIRR